MDCVAWTGLAATIQSTNGYVVWSHSASTHCCRLCHCAMHKPHLQAYVHPPLRVQHQLLLLVGQMSPRWSERRLTCVSSTSQRLQATMEQQHVHVDHMLLNFSLIVLLSTLVWHAWHVHQPQHVAQQLKRTRCAPALHCTTMNPSRYLHSSMLCCATACSELTHSDSHSLHSFSHPCLRPGLTSANSAA
jgi:hypothetical protein